MDEEVVQFGIIYKFTIIDTDYTFNGNKNIFYVGKHRSDELGNYPGSGSIWGDFITKLKRDYRYRWREHIKTEILYKRKCTLRCLNAMERYFIKHEKAHYSFDVGGCNVAWGGDNSPVDVITKKKISNKNSGRILSNETRRRVSNFHTGKKLSEETRKKMSLSKIGDNNPMKRKEVREKVSNANCGKQAWNKGKNWSDEAKKKMSESRKGKEPWNKGKKMSDEIKMNLSKALKGRKLSEAHKENIRRCVTENPPFKGRHHTEQSKEKLRQAALKQFSKKNNTNE